MGGAEVISRVIRLYIGRVFTEIRISVTPRNFAQLFETSRRFSQLLATLPIDMRIHLPVRRWGNIWASMEKRPQKEKKDTHHQPARKLGANSAIIPGIPTGERLYAVLFGALFCDRASNIPGPVFSRSWF